MRLLSRTVVSLAVVLAASGCVNRTARNPVAPAAGSVTNSSLLNAKGGSADTNAPGHPLTHPEFKMITAPKGTWNSHWMYPNEVMSYLLKGPADAALARRVLAEYGLGKGDKSYLFIARGGTPLVVNGTVFKSRKDAVAFVRKEKIPRLLYVPENNAFPSQIPVWFDEEKISVWVLKWQR